MGHRELKCPKRTDKNHRLMKLRFLKVLP